ncbi:hypothetical protein F4824DRAFT_333550 [Ustulina deusta]|nr:hypothetical protein F4824DRAFT_333550 [Ustulina deusta]
MGGPDRLPVYCKYWGKASLLTHLLTIEIEGAIPIRRSGMTATTLRWISPTGTRRWSSPSRHRPTTHRTTSSSWWWTATSSWTRRSSIHVLLQVALIRWWSTSSIVHVLWRRTIVLTVSIIILFISSIAIILLVLVVLSLRRWWVCASRASTGNSCSRASVGPFCVSVIICHRVG